MCDINTAESTNLSVSADIIDSLIESVVKLTMESTLDGTDKHTQNSEVAETSQEETNKKTSEKNEELNDIIDSLSTLQISSKEEPKESLKEHKDITTDTTKDKIVPKKGQNCSKEGQEYEKQIYQIVKHCTLHDKPFNTQKEDELAGCSALNDIECNFNKEKDIPIEIKKANTPDWMQCKLTYNTTTNKWTGALKNKIPDKSKKIFEELINNIKLFNGKIPPFMVRDITHEEWTCIKKETTDFNDTYIDCPSTTIQELYREKGCKYIQISDGYGLYHLGEDICELNVPEFVCDQRLRIRTKIHTTKNVRGFCSLSVTVACQPTNIKNLTKSNYSLDDIAKLPVNLIYTSPEPQSDPNS
jgi:hypothetical protein